ncbi:hypothetical protein BD311DRAFT_726968 [Dichomitus squalens]|uniref:Uncharacterized protein n=1 Tax=Dichomitus squalens TaxID=114155 RepID=A0A4Q9MJ21_9APHY|nr:hypothetical protein BD311DRAFT_726968 [Dichomitus squalens]
MHRLVLTFDAMEVATEPLLYLEELRKIQMFMEITLLQRFPHLRTICLDVRSTDETLPWWKTHIGECYPMLLSKGILEVATSRMHSTRRDWHF